MPKDPPRFKLGSVQRYVRFYVPPAAITALSMKAAKGWDGSAKHHITAATGDGKVHRRMEWRGCAACVKDPLLMSPRCTRKLDVGSRETTQMTRATPERLASEVRV